MDQTPHLKKAPINEALIDIRVKLPNNFDPAQLDIHEQIKEDYPTRQEIKSYENTLEFKEGVPHTTTIETEKGFKYTSVNKLYVAQARTDGFTISRLKPYEKWDDLRSEGRKLWALYKNITNPIIVRVALRYINKINIPSPIKDFGDYFTAPPIVPEKLPQGISSYFNRVVIREPNYGLNAIVTNSMEPVSIGDKIPLVLDIDVFKTEAKGIDEDEAWETLDKIRDFKNEIFYNSLTKELLETFK